MRWSSRGVRWLLYDRPVNAVLPVRLNFACGGTRWEGFDNSDVNGEDGTSYVDLKSPPYPYANESAELILISHGLFSGYYGEMLHPDCRPILDEFHRILQPGGWLRIDDNPFRCYDEQETLDPFQAELEAPRGYHDEWRLPRGYLIAKLFQAGFVNVYNHGVNPQLSHAAAAFPDAADAIYGNGQGHYSFTMEARR